MTVTEPSPRSVVPCWRHISSVVKLLHLAAGQDHHPYVSAGTGWCSGTLPLAHSRDDACSAQAGSVSNGGNKIKPGDICTIAPAYNPFEPGWIRTDKELHTFECGLDGKWSKQTPHPFTVRQIACDPMSQPLHATSIDP